MSRAENANRNFGPIGNKQLGDGRHVWSSGGSFKRGVPRVSRGRSYCETYRPCEASQSPLASRSIRPNGNFASSIVVNPLPREGENEIPGTKPKLRSIEYPKRQSEMSVPGTPTDDRGQRFVVLQGKLFLKTIHHRQRVKRHPSRHNGDHCGQERAAANQPNDVTDG